MWRAGVDRLDLDASNPKPLTPNHKTLNPQPFTSLFLNPPSQLSNSDGTKSGDDSTSCHSKVNSEPVTPTRRLEGKP